MSKKVSSVNAEKNKKILLDLLKEPGNKNCAECNARGPLCWASVNLGVFFCTRCAGVHRGIGVHITFVKGVNLDVWEDKHLEMLIKMGNEKSNAYYEAGLPPSKKPTESSSAREVEEFLRNKYEKKKWVVRNNDRNDDDQYERRKNPTQSPRNNHREVAPSPPRREQPRRSSNGHREEQRRQPQKQSLFEEDEDFTPQARSQGSSSNAPSVSSFAQLSNRTSKPSQPPQQKVSQSNNLFEFDEPAKPQQNSTSIDDMFEGVFSNQNQQPQKGGQQQHQVQSTHQPKSANILNLFDQPQNPTMVPQRQQGYPQTFSPQFPNQQFQQPPQQFQQHYGHPHHMQQMHHMQQQHYPQQQFQQHQQYPQGGFSPQYPNQQQFQQHPQGFGGQQPQYQQQQQQYQQRRGF